METEKNNRSDNDEQISCEPFRGYVDLFSGTEKSCYRTINKKPSETSVHQRKYLDLLLQDN